MSLVREGLLIGLGDAMHFSTEAATQWLEREGREYTAAPLPADIPRGTPKNCFGNATHLVSDNHWFGDGSLQYVEGVVTRGAFLIYHAWAVRPDGTVVDPTLDRPEECRYFGVPFDIAWLRRYIAKTKYYGVLGGSSKHGAKFLTSKGIDPRAVDEETKKFLARLATEQTG